MKPTDCTAHDCLLGGTRIPYESLQRDYVCERCGGGIVVRIDPRHPGLLRPECSVCHDQDFIHHSTYEVQLVKAWEIRRGLPDHLKELLPDERKTLGLTFEQAVKDLYGEGS